MKYDEIRIYKSQLGRKIDLFFVFFKDDKPIKIFNDYWIINNKTVKINSRRLVNELKTFVYNASTKKAESQKRKHDDAIMSLCLGLYVRDTQNRNTPIGADVPQEVTSVFKTELYEQIKKEILEGAPEDMFAPETIDLLAYDKTELNSLAFDVRRKYDSLLREFGW